MHNKNYMTLRNSTGMKNKSIKKGHYKYTYKYNIGQIYIGTIIPGPGWYVKRSKYQTHIDRIAINTIKNRNSTQITRTQEAQQVFK